MKTLVGASCTFSDDRKNEFFGLGPMPRLFIRARIDGIAFLFVNQFLTYFIPPWSKWIINFNELILLLKIKRKIITIFWAALEHWSMSQSTIPRFNHLFFKFAFCVCFRLTSVISSGIEEHLAKEIEHHLVIGLV